MADHDSIVSSSKLSAIADAIREKTGKDELLTLDQMPTEIESISGGGGGAVPESCGIVPTSWSAKGYVLTADSYGDIQMYALASSSHIDRRNYNVDDDPFSSDEYEFFRAYSYLTEITFQTNPEAIGPHAFEYSYWLEIPELPEGLEIIGEYAFYDCYATEISIIPSTVSSIGREAFYGTGNASYIVPAWNEDANYTPGQCAEYSSDVYTCIRNTRFQPSGEDWIQGYYPEMLGVYSASNNYNVGGIVYSPDDYGVSTIVLGMSSMQTLDEYAPDIVGIHNETTNYTRGQVVAYLNDDDSEVIKVPLTCLQATSGGVDADYWMYGDYPEVVGVYDNTQTYDVGDVVAVYTSDELPFGYYIPFTCYVPVTSPEEYDSNKWIAGYYPELLGEYDNTRTYAVGDIITDGYTCSTCVVAVTSPEEYNYEKWMDGYYPGITVYDSEQSYSVGDVIAAGDESSGYTAYTCITANSDVDPSSDYDHEYWLEGAYPDISGIYNPSETYALGDTVYSPDDYIVITIIQSATYSGIPALGYYPDTKEEYNSSHTYHAGDVVYITDDSYDPIKYEFYLCITNTSTTGEFDSNEWQLLGDSTSFSQFKLHSLEFKGTPTTIDSNALYQSIYNLILVPWSNGDVSDAPWGANYDTPIIYDYDPGINE